VESLAWLKPLFRQFEKQNCAQGKLIMSASLLEPAIRRWEISLPRDVTLCRRDDGTRLDAASEP